MGSSDIEFQQREFSEKRKSPRSSVFIDVNYSIAGRVRTDFIRNICNGGVFIETREPLSYGQDIVMTFRHPSSQDHLKLRGYVLRIDKQGVGVKFFRSKPLIAEDGINRIERQRNRMSLEEDCVRVLSAVHGRLLKDQIREKYGEEVFAREFQLAIKVALKEIQKKHGVSKDKAVETLKRAVKKMPHAIDAKLQPSKEEVGNMSNEKFTLPSTVDEKYLHHNFGPKPRKMDFGPGAAFFRSAVQLFNLNDYEKSASLFKKAIETGLEPEIMAAAYCRLGIIAFKEKKMKGAIENFLKCLESPFRIDTDVSRAAAHLQIIFAAANHVAGAEEFDRLCKAARGDWIGTGTSASGLRKYRSFEQAREFAQGLGLKSQSDWKKFCKGEMPEKGVLPEDIPAAPRQVYKGEGWAGMGDWLGTGRIANQLKKFRPFQEAREFARNLGLKNNDEWRRFCRGEMPQKGVLPQDIPANPWRVYRDKGWAGKGDWLGTGTVAPRLRKYRSFKEAREFARSLGLKNESEWRRFCKGEMSEKGVFPEDIAADPRQVYKDKGWTGMGDWLGTGTVAPRLRKYRSFKEAREFVHGLGLKSQSEWRKFCKGEMPEKGVLPKDIPVAAWNVYKDKGWAGMGDWLGSVKREDR